MLAVMMRNQGEGQTGVGDVVARFMIYFFAVGPTSLTVSKSRDGTIRRDGTERLTGKTIKRSG